MPEPESLPSDELVDVLEHALAPMTAEQLRDELLDAGMDVTMRQVRLALTLLADERRVRETQNGRWALRARAPAPRAAAPPEVAPLPGVRPRVGPATARAAARVQVTSGASGRTIIRAPNVAARQPAPPPPAPPPPAAPNPAAPPRPVGASQDEIWAALARTVASGLRPLPHGASLPLILAAHEWSLATPLNINRREDLLSLPVIKVEPFEHQVRSIVAFFRRLSPRGLIADDVGLGKTITAGLILAELIKRRRAQTFLVVAPKLILEQWRAELWEKFNIEAIACVGAKLPEALRRGRVITTYQTVSRYYDDVKAAAPDVLILDEIHKIRNLYSPNPPLMAQRVHQLQREGVSRWVIGLSATPLQNRLVDLYSIADVLRAPNPNPYGSITRFAQTYLEDGQYGRRLRPQAAAEFRRRTSEYMHRTRRQDSGMSFPGRIVHIDAVPVSAAERHALDEALKALVAAGANPLERINLAQSILSSPAAARAAVRKQIDKGHDGFRSVLPLFEALAHTGKLGRLLALVRELRTQDPVGWRILVFTLRKATADAIRAALHAEGLGEEVVEVRGDQGAQNQAAVERFTASPPQARVLVSTDAGAEGVNLQACNVLVNFDLPWNPMLLEQRVGRVQRLGQQARSVIIYNLVTKGTVEEQVVSRLYEKLRLYDAAIGMAEEILGQLGDEADSDDFAKRVLRLVEAAVQRRDVDEMQREMEESVRKAHKELEQQSAEIERVLGAVDMPEPVAMPAITPTRPSMDLRTFWQAAMRASGWNLEARDGGATLEATQRGRAPRRFTFDPSHRFRQVQIIGAHAVELVASDERALDEMVRAWSLDGLDATTVRPAPPLVDTERQIEATLAPRVKWVISRQPGGLSHRGDVTILARVNTSVFHDQYEKILRVTQPVELSADGDPRTAAMGARLGPALVRALRSAIEQDEDIQNFSGFYLSRRATEKAQVLRALGESQQATPELQRRLIAEIDDRLTPLHEARLIAVSGELHARQLLQLEVELDTGRVVRVEVDLDGQADVTQHLSTLAERRGGGAPSVCDAGHLTGSAALVPCSAPGCGLQRCGSCREWTACATCRGVLCADHTLRCSGCAGTVCDAHVVHLSSGALACAGCSGTCAASDRVVLARELVLCQKTGLKALPSEMARCAVSKLLVLRRELVACEVSGELALPERLVASAGSGKTQRKGARPRRHLAPPGARLACSFASLERTRSAGAAQRQRSMETEGCR